MGNQFKLTLTILFAVTCALVSEAGAYYVCFDSNQLTRNDAKTIEAYIESIHGSDVTVLNAIAGNGRSPAGTNYYIHESPFTTLLFDRITNTDSFHIYVSSATGTFSFDSDESEFVTQMWSCRLSDNSTITCFGPLTKTLLFTNPGLRRIQLDDRRVKPIPEPAAVSLVCLILADWSSFANVNKQINWF